jgi:YD repeat-containing protein
VGNLDTDTLPNGVLSEYGYDELNRLASVTHTRTRSDGKTKCAAISARNACNRGLAWLLNVAIRLQVAPVGHRVAAAFDCPAPPLSKILASASGRGKMRRQVARWQVGSGCKDYGSNTLFKGVVLAGLVGCTIAKTSSSE